MSDLRTAAQQALEALLTFPHDISDEMFAAIAALKAALAQEQAEPVAWIHTDSDKPRVRFLEWREDEPGYRGRWIKTPLYTAPPQQPSPEPVARECSDHMCACRGGPCAECEEGQREKEIEDLRCSLDFYQRRCEALQSWQSKMRDPERTIVCDILANGFTLDPAFAGNRYTAPPRCPNCASLEAQNNELDRKLAELEQEEPVAKVELMMTGGNAGLATRIVEIDDPLRERLRPGQVLYTAPPPPQRKPLSLTDLQEALVLTNLIDRDAIDNPDEYDKGSTLAQIDALHRIIKEDKA